jgi:hypothetical protein
VELLAVELLGLDARGVADGGHQAVDLALDRARGVHGLAAPFRRGHVGLDQRHRAAVEVL